LPLVTFRVTCSKGTYVRTLAEDIGEALGCGAHLTALRRTGVGALTLERAVTLDELTGMNEAERDARLQPVDALLSTFPAVQLNDEATKRFLHGQRLRLADVVETRLEEGRVRVYAQGGGRLLGVARAGEGVLAPERLIVTAQ
jgi:tRNA pseudouridine55 synthase